MKDAFGPISVIAGMTADVLEVFRRASLSRELSGDVRFRFVTRQMAGLITSPYTSISTEREDQWLPYADRKLPCHILHMDGVVFI